jgi:rhodanese-related sulfurtransferase
MQKLFMLVGLIAALSVFIYLSGCTMPAEMDEEAGAGEEAAGEETISFTDLSPAEAKELIETTDVIVIDVSPHYSNGHLPGAVHYYLGDGSLDEAIPSLDPNATYLVYCHIDSVAITGAQKLVDAGFANVYRLEGNYSAWVAAGYEVEQ